MKKLIMAAIAIVILVVAFLFISPPLNRDGQSDLPNPAENSVEMPPEETAEPVFFDGVQVDENTSAIMLNADSSVEELAALAGESHRAGADRLWRKGAQRGRAVPAQ